MDLTGLANYTPQELLETAYARGLCPDPSGRFAVGNFALLQVPVCTSERYVHYGYAYQQADAPATHDEALRWIRMRNRARYEALAREAMTVWREWGYNPEAPVLWGPVELRVRAVASSAVTMVPPTLSTFDQSGEARCFYGSRQDPNPPKNPAMSQLYEFGVPVTMATPEVIVLTVGRGDRGRKP